MKRFLAIGTGRRAFTLVEVLLAMGMTSALMFAIWRTLEIHQKISERGIRQANAAAVERGLLHQLNDDLANIRRPWEFPVAQFGDVPAEEAETLGVDFGGEREGIGTRSEQYVSSAPNDRAAHATQPSDALGIVGESDWLMIDVSPSEYSARTESPLNLSVVSSYVVYTFRPQFESSALSKSAPGTASMGMLRRSVVKPEVNSPVSAVADFMASDSQRREELPTSDPFNSPSTRPATFGECLDPRQTEDIPEIGWCTFRYFDGRSWNSEWRGRREVPVVIAFFYVRQQDLPSSTVRTRGSLEKDFQGSAREDGAAGDPFSFTSELLSYVDGMLGDGLERTLATNSEDRLEVRRVLFYLDTPPAQEQSRIVRDAGAGDDS